MSRRHDAIKELGHAAISRPSLRLAQGVLQTKLAASFVSPEPL